MEWRGMGEREGERRRGRGRVQGKRRKGGGGGRGGRGRGGVGWGEGAGGGAGEERGVKKFRPENAPPKPTISWNLALESTLSDTTRPVSSNDVLLNLPVSK